MASREDEQAFFPSGFKVGRVIRPSPGPPPYTARRRGLFRGCWPRKPGWWIKLSGKAAWEPGGQGPADFENAYPDPSRPSLGARRPRIRSRMRWPSCSGDHGGDHGSHAYV